jgi:hypothetical protein
MVSVDGFKDVDIKVLGKGLLKQRPIKKIHGMSIFNLDFDL